jgi:hypothetical protein
MLNILRNMLALFALGTSFFTVVEATLEDFAFAIFDAIPVHVIFLS